MAQNQHHHLNQMAQPDLCWQITLQCFSPWQIPQQDSGFFLGNSCTNYCLNFDLMRGVSVWGVVWTQKQRGFLQSVLCLWGWIKVRLQPWRVSCVPWNLSLVVWVVLRKVPSGNVGRVIPMCHPEFPKAVCELRCGELLMSWRRKSCEMAGRQRKETSLVQTPLLGFWNDEINLNFKFAVISCPFFQNMKNGIYMKLCVKMHPLNCY